MREDHLALMSVRGVFPRRTGKLVGPHSPGVVVLEHVAFRRETAIMADSVVVDNVRPGIGAHQLPFPAVI